MSEYEIVIRLVTGADIQGVKEALAVQMEQLGAVQIVSIRERPLVEQIKLT